MTSFAIGVAGLLLLAAWMLRPAWRHSPAPVGRRPAHLGILGEQLAALDRERAEGRLDAQQHAQACREVQRRVLDETATDEPAATTLQSPKAPLLVAVAIPLFAIALYAAIGNPAGLNVSVTTNTAQTAPAPEVSPEAVQEMLARLAQRLETPSGNSASDLQGWTMLARSYAALQRFADSERAFARAIALAPNDAQLLADRADVLSALQDSRTTGEQDRLIAQALRIDPSNLKALALAGSAAFERKDFAAARERWQKARDLAPGGGEFAAGLDRSLIAARDASSDGAPAGAPAAPAPPATPAPTVAATPPATQAGPGPARITGRVSLAPALAAKAAPGDTLFIFARAAEGPRMPLAIIRRTVADLPFDFTLDDSLAMSPQTRLSSASRVIVGARVSRSGNAMPQPGDLRGESAAIGIDSQGLRLSIDGVQP